MSLRIKLYHQRERLKSYFNRQRHGYCNVLLYHRVFNTSFDPQMLCVSVENFELQLTALKKNHEFLTLDEFTDALRFNKKLPKNSLLISFDDGYADNYIHALPVLESLNLQAVFYISTANINNDAIFWWDEADLVFKNSAAEQFEQLSKKHKISSKEELYQYYLSGCKMASSLEQRDAMMEELRSVYKVTKKEKSDYRCLTLSELKSLSASRSAVIGAHTVNHLALGCLPDADQEYEIKTSVDYLSGALGYRIEHFSFPYGEKKHYNDFTITTCKNLNLKSAAANYYDYVRRGADVFSFPRVVVRNDKADVLLNKIRTLT